MGQKWGQIRFILINHKVSHKNNYIKLNVRLSKCHSGLTPPLVDGAIGVGMIISMMYDA